MGSRGREGTRVIKSLGTHQVHGTSEARFPAHTRKEFIIASSSWSLSYPPDQSRKLTRSGFMNWTPSAKRDHSLLWLRDWASWEEGARTSRYCLRCLVWLDVLQHLVVACLFPSDHPFLHVLSPKREPGSIGDLVLSDCAYYKESAWWHMPPTLVLEGGKQDDPKFKAKFDQLLRPVIEFYKASWQSPKQFKIISEGGRKGEKESLTSETCLQNWGYSESPILCCILEGLRIYWLESMGRFMQTEGHLLNLAIK